jgi:toxin ParE1/3/4
VPNAKWAASAERDLNDIIEYIARDSIAVALEKLNSIRREVEVLSRFPRKGRIIPELKNHNVTKYREVIYSPWRIFYKIENKTVYIMAVIDGRRNIEDILLQKQLR